MHLIYLPKHHITLVGHRLQYHARKILLSVEIVRFYRQYGPKSIAILGRDEIFYLGYKCQIVNETI